MGRSCSQDCTYHFSNSGEVNEILNQSRVKLYLFCVKAKVGKILYLQFWWQFEYNILIFIKDNPYNANTEQVGPSGNTSFSYLGAEQIKIATGTTTILIEVFVVFLSVSGSIPGYCLKLGYNFFCNSLFTNIQSSTLYTSPSNWQCHQIKYWGNSWKILYCAVDVSYFWHLFYNWLLIRTVH